MRRWTQRGAQSLPTFHSPKEIGCRSPLFLSRPPRVGGIVRSSWPPQRRDVDIRNISILEARSVRREVLRPDLSDSEVAYPGDDSELAQHLGAFEGNQLIAVATFLPEACPNQDGEGAWRLRGMATVRSAESRGIGGRLLLYGIERLWRQGATVIWCYGRASARTFYERHGFRASGSEFESLHIGPHLLFLLHARLLLPTSAQRGLPAPNRQVCDRGPEPELR